MKVPTVVVLGMLLGLAGCPGPDTRSGDTSKPASPAGSGDIAPPSPDTDTAPDPVDGTWCGHAAHGMKVFINIRYAPNGTPSASPGTCEVDQGATITWRGPSDSSTMFQLDFPGGPPTAAEHVDLVSGSSHGPRQKLKIVASSSPGTYKYGITANGQKVDPDVIIRPN